jgi:hypothetical protein
MTGKGTTNRLRYLEGARLTPKQAIQAKCSDCMTDYGDGRVDCGVKTCPLYPWMPYNRARGMLASIPRPKKSKEGVEGGKPPSGPG